MRRSKNVFKLIKFDTQMTVNEIHSAIKRFRLLDALNTSNIQFKEQIGRLTVNETGYNLVNTTW